jgi:saccharopine dehydrogenase (NAD+, L-lysine-forming)
MFGHAFKGQHSGRRLLQRFKEGGGTLYDLEYLVDEDGRRVAAFGYWAGYAGAAVSLMSWAAQQGGGTCPPVATFAGRDALLATLGTQLDAVGGGRPTAIVIGALGRVGTGASDLCAAMGVTVTKWDMAETASGGPFPEILDHALFINCILARPGTPVFVPKSALTQPRRLRVIGDVACDPDSDYNPVPVYDRATTWAEPALRVHDAPPLDVMAIDNLPSLLPRESSQDFAAQLLPHLATLDSIDAGVWGRARAIFDTHIKEV